MSETPLEDYQVDRPEVQTQQCVQRTGTNGETLDRNFRALPNQASDDAPGTERVGCRIEIRFGRSQFSPRSLIEVIRTDDPAAENTC